MKKLDDYRLKLGRKEYVPIMLGGMGVDISTSDLALEVSSLGGIGHISDALIQTVSDRHYGTNFDKERLARYKHLMSARNKAEAQFDLDTVEKATRFHVENTMNRKKGDGAIYINCMEKLTMNNPKETLKARLSAAMDAGIDGITLAAGLHLGSFDLIKAHSRFRDVSIGIIVSSLRALTLFLKRAARAERMPDFVVVEGPLAGGHLGFGVEDWKKYNLKDIMKEVLGYLKDKGLDIPVIPAGGIFTGSDGVEFMGLGASAIQVANRFTVTKECGLPDDVKQEYFKANEDDIEVNAISPTGYPMRMLKRCPAIGSGVKPNCESLGYLLDKDGNCSYIGAYYTELEKGNDTVSIFDKTCLCVHMKNYKCWTCGHYVYRLKDTTNKMSDGSYQILPARHVFEDYQYSTNHGIKLPALP
ncbi:MAG: nitronate monooxygenase [bacterium]|nr:nitronate monooxygenase [bacterium]